VQTVDNVQTIDTSTVLPIAMLEM